jgi:hypothetical protein
MSKRAPRVKPVIFILVALLIVSSLASFSQAAGEPRLSKGQTIYVPVYSNIYVGDRALPWNLSANLSVRNTDPSNPITVLAVDYYDSEGKLVKNYLSKPKQLNPMGSDYYYVKTSDTTGGYGANFLVEWKSEKKVNEPIIESLMSGLRGNHSVSFLSPGREVAK